MKEELQSKLVEILASIQNAAGKAGDFAMAQLPDIAQQYVVYGRATSIAWLVVAAALSYGIYKLCRTTHDGVCNRGWDEMVWLPTAFVVMVLSTFTAIIGASLIDNGLLVWFAPKVWLIKELASLVK